MVYHIRPTIGSSGGIKPMANGAIALDVVTIVFVIPTYKVQRISKIHH